MFSAGNKVICIDDKPREGTPWDRIDPKPKRGGIYTVDLVVYDKKGSLALVLDEFDHKFIADRFMPLHIEKNVYYLQWKEIEVG